MTLENKKYMKKLIVIAILALGALSACTKVEMIDRPARKISFEAGSYAIQTKANSALSTSLVFNSRAFLHANGVAGVQPVFGTGAGEQVHYVSGSNTWEPGATTGNEYFWPLSPSSYINFVCWYDKNGTPDTGALSETSLTWDGRTVASDDEIMFADAAWHYNSNTSNGEQYAGDAITSGVPVIFHHALSQVCFKAKIKDGCVSDGNTTWRVTISNFAISNVYKSGTLALTNAEPAGTAPATRPWTGSWAVDTEGDTESFPDKVSSLTLTSATATDLLPMRTVLPQNVTTDMIMSFDWKISTYENGVLFSEEYLQYTGMLRLLAPEIETWSMGTQITYTLVIDPSANYILISPVVSDWEMGGSSSVVVE